MEKDVLVFELTDVSVRYGVREVVHSVSFALSGGESLGLLGPNGAGKTSTIRALLGMMPHSGTIRLFNDSKRQVSHFQHIGFAPEEGIPPEYLSGEEYLRFAASFRGEKTSAHREQALELLDWFELEPRKRIGDYSKGMKRRIVLAQAFIGDPKLLILDEPLNGLDPLMIIKLRDRLEQFQRLGRSILYSSHILTEIQRTCTRIAILGAGKLVYLASMGQLLGEYGSVEQAFATTLGERRC